MPKLRFSRSLQLKAKYVVKLTFQYPLTRIFKCCLPSMLGFKCYDIEMTWWASTPLLHNTKCTQRAPCIYATALCLCTLSHTGEVSPTLRGAWQAMQLLSRTYLYASFGNKINERRNTSPSLQVWLPIRTCFYWLQAASKPYYTDSPMICHRLESFLKSRTHCTVMAHFLC